MSFPPRPRPPHRSDRPQRFDRPSQPRDRGPSRRPEPRLPSPETPAPSGSADWPQPWAQMKYFSFNPAVYPNMISAVSRDAAAGDLIHVMDKDGQPFGTGFFNPRAKIPLRVLQHGAEPLTEADLDARLERAVLLRRDALKLDAVTNAYRVVFSDGDGLSGLTVDRYADTLSIEVTTLGVWKRLRRWLPKMHELLGTTQHVIQVDPEVAQIEGMRMADVPEIDAPAPATVRIQEHGIRYQVNFPDGHKTGFFCDQRDNRLRFGQLVAGKRVLDLCCYTGGFALAAKLIGKCEDVTAVDLDEKSIASARKNADINQVRLSLTQSDAFGWGRQMIANGEQWDAVVLDPPKFLFSREPESEEAKKGRNKYYDLNAVALQLVKPGGLFVTCSCSGLLSLEEFEEIVCRAAHRNKRKLQILDRTGAGMDHPVMSNCPDGRYLKVIWAVVV
ncbi:MAG: class I SAM-dependent rRNA methyltransferase [Verrucomicrobiaceae bacterium]|nr:class I SAM-dependent rRNA methyltransferase [Verrucomicrobiaceae bacterium]